MKSLTMVMVTMIRVAGSWIHLLFHHLMKETCVDALLEDPLRVQGLAWLQDAKLTITASKCWSVFGLKNDQGPKMR